MKVVILGAGKMGMFMADTLCMEHDVAVYARIGAQAADTH